MSTRPHSLVIATRVSSNRIFEHYCTGIRENSETCSVLTRADYAKLGKRGFEAHVHELLSEQRVTHVFYLIADEMLDPAFIAAVGKRTATVMVFFDTEYQFERRDRYYAQLADLVLLPDYLAQYRFALMGVPADCTFSLYDSRQYRKLEDGARDLDVSFVGIVAKNYGRRSEHLGFLEQHGIACEAYGQGAANGRVEFEEMVRIFNRSKINLNFTELADQKLPARIDRRVRQSKGRPIEAALCGGFVLSQYAPGIEHMFEIGKEIEVFRGKEELLEKVRYYLAHDEEREAMAGRAHARALREYDATRGFARVFEKLGAGAYPKAEKTFYLDPDFLRLYGTYRVDLMLEFISRGAWKFAFEELVELMRVRRISFRQAAAFLRAHVSRQVRVRVS